MDSSPRPRVSLALPPPFVYNCSLGGLKPKSFKSMDCSAGRDTLGDFLPDSILIPAALALFFSYCCLMWSSHVDRNWSKFLTKTSLFPVSVSILAHLALALFSYS